MITFNEIIQFEGSSEVVVTCSHVVFISIHVALYKHDVKKLIKCGCLMTYETFYKGKHMTYRCYKRNFS